MGNSGANKILQGGLINVITFAEIDGARCLRIKSSIEETLRILQGSPFEKIELHVVFESAGAANRPDLSPHRGVPLPFLSNVRGSLQNQFVQSGKHFAAPIGQILDLVVNMLGWSQTIF